MDLKYSHPPDNTEVIKGAVQATVKAAKEVSTVCVHLDNLFCMCTEKYKCILKKKIPAM